MLFDMLVRFWWIYWLKFHYGGCGPSWVPAMTPNNARIKKNHSKTGYNGRIVFLSIFRSCADLKSGMSTFCQSPKIYFEWKFFIQDFFFWNKLDLYFRMRRIIKIGSLVQFRHPFKSVDPPPSWTYFNILVHIHPDTSRRYPIFVGDCPA